MFEGTTSAERAFIGRRSSAYRLEAKGEGTIYNNIDNIIQQHCALKGESYPKMVENYRKLGRLCRSLEDASLQFRD